MSSKPNTSVEANDQQYGYDTNLINHEEKRNVRDDKLLPPLMNAIERKKQVEYLILSQQDQVFYKKFYVIYSPFYQST